MGLMFTRSKETEALARFFAEMSIGQTVSIEDLSKAVGFVVTPALGSYSSARRVAMKDSGVVIETVRGVGVKRLSGEEIALGRGAYRDARAHKQLTTGLKEQAVALSMNLPRDVASVASRRFERSSIAAHLMTPIKVKSNRTVVPEPEKAEWVDPREQLARAFAAKG